MMNLCTYVGWVIVRTLYESDKILYSVCLFFVRQCVIVENRNEFDREF